MDRFERAFSGMLAVVTRELRVRARQSQTYSTRVWVVLIGGAVLGLMFFGQRYSRGGSMVGSYLFGLLTWSGFLFCLFQGVRATADTISDERREGTLGLLFLTPLKGRDVVLGKVLGTAVQGCFAALALCPVLAVPLLTGGVTAGQYWGVIIGLVLTTLVSCSVGLWISAQSWSEGRTWGGTILVLAGLALGPLIVGSLMPFSGVQLAALGAPVYWGVSRGSILDGAFLVSCVCQIGWMGLLIWRTGKRLEDSWNEGPLVARLTAPELRIPEEWRGLSRMRGRRAPEVLEENPALWLALRGDRQRTARIVGIMLGVIYGFLAVASMASDGMMMVMFTVTPIAHLVFLVWISLSAGQMLGEARRSGFLEAWLTTPLSPEEIVGGELLAMRRTFLAPVMTLTVIELLAMLMVLWAPEGAVWMYPGMLLINTGAFGLGCYAVSYLGVWRALVSKTPQAARGTTVLFGVVLPLIVSVMCCGVQIVYYLVLSPIARGRVRAETKLLGPAK